MSYIKFKEVNKIYKVVSREINVLQNINFDIKKNEITLIYGKTGSGKTTLLNILAGYEKTSNGNITVDNILVNKLNKKDLNKYIRKYTGYVSFEDDLIDNETILENLLLSVNLVNENIEIEKLVDSFDLSNSLNLYPKELSKIEKIKVQTLRALCKNPKIIILDEIFLNMEKKDIKQVLKTVFSFARKNKVPVIIADYDKKFNSYVNKIVTLKDGKIEKIKVNEKIKPIGDFK